MNILKLFSYWEWLRLVNSLTNIYYCIKKFVKRVRAMYKGGVYV